MSESSAANVAPHYWTRFWQQHGHDSRGQTEQYRVLRTLDKRPIDEVQWQATANYVLGHLDVRPVHDVLDLAGGNGLFANQIKSLVNSVTVVDVAESLLPPSSGNVTAVCSDMRQVEFCDDSFDRILLYAAIQYLTLPEAARLMKKMYQWLKPNGILYVGDIPNVAKQWSFFDSDVRRQAYFAGLSANQPIVGTWFCQDWLDQLASHVGFKNVAVMDQPDDQIYAWFRFDFRGEK